MSKCVSSPPESVNRPPVDNVLQRDLYPRVLTPAPLFARANNTPTLEANAASPSSNHATTSTNEPYPPNPPPLVRHLRDLYLLREPLVLNETCLFHPLSSFVQIRNGGA
jgi:hypothetical protein